MSCLEEVMGWIILYPKEDECMSRRLGNEIEVKRTFSPNP